MSQHTIFVSDVDVSVSEVDVCDVVVSEVLVADFEVVVCVSDVDWRQKRDIYQF